VTGWTLYPGRGRLSDAASPDLRGRSFRISAVLVLPTRTDHGVVVAHGDRHGGYAVRVDELRHLVHHHVHAGTHTVVRSAAPLPVGRPVQVQVQLQQRGEGGHVQLLVDGALAGEGSVPALPRARTGYTGLDVGCDRGLTVGGYAAPARFTGRLPSVRIEADDDQRLDEAAVLEIEGTTG
jgi:arylsulfatase